MKYEAVIKKFGSQGEKTGWSYISLSPVIAEQLFPGNKKTFRVQGSIDKMKIEKVAVLPMGDGSFILPLNAAMRKELGKQKGAKVTVNLKADRNDIEMPGEFKECLADEPEAFAFFSLLAKSHQNYFIKWIATAKTDVTRAKRISLSLAALGKKQKFPEMIRSLKENEQDGLPF